MGRPRLRNPLRLEPPDITATHPHARASSAQLTNDPSNPHFLRPEFRAVEIDALTGMDSTAMRFGPGEHGIERSWTRSFNDHGKEFVVRFIVLDEETTHSSTLGMSYVYDADSVTGWKPVRANGEAGTNADPAVVDDFAEPVRPFFGADQMAWFVRELKKPAHLRLVFNGRALRTRSAPTVNHPKRSCLCGPRLLVMHLQVHISVPHSIHR